MSNVIVFHDNYASLDNLNGYTYSTQQSSFPVTNVFDFQRRAKVWRSNTTSGWLRFDLGSSQTVSAVILIGPRNQPIRISPSATILLQGNHTDVWTTPSVEIQLDYSSSIIQSVDQSGFGSYRYWRLYIDDPTNTYGYIEIGVVYLGDLYSPVNGSVQFPFSSDFVDTSLIVTAESGHVISNERPKGQNFSITWFALTKDEIDFFSEFFDDVGTTKPFFINFDPRAVFSTTEYKHLRYVRFGSSPGYRLIAPNLFTMDMSLREVL